MPSPSVTLWIMKPTIRNAPSCNSPSAKEAPIASPSPRLCRPMPTAINSASVRPVAVPPLRQTPGERRHPEEAQRDAEQDESRTAERRRERRLQIERLGQRLDAEERQQTRP